MDRISKKVAQIEESVTFAVDTRQKELKAQGEPVIGFGIGEPDFPTPAHIVEAAQKAAAERASHGYSAVAGLPKLREAVAAKTIRDSGLETQTANVLITNGGKHAIFNTCMTLLNDGDEVLIPSPYWGTYPDAVKVAGGVPVVIPTDETSGYRATVEQLEAARTSRTKMLIFVSPSNPTGAVYSRQEIEAIGKWAFEHNVWVMCDEIYEHLVYGENEQYSMPVVVPELKDTCVVVNGVAKTFAMTGWRVGWMVAPVDVIKAATNLQSHSTSNVANVSQQAALTAVTGPLDCVQEMREAYDRRRHLMVKMLSEIDGVICPEPEGAFYTFPSVKGLLGRPLGPNGSVVETSLQLAELFLEEARVAVVPGEAFGAPGYLRISYAVADDDIREGITRIADLALGKLPKLGS